jgi:RNA polymerase sigma factor for flagellar operon FliA
VTLLIDPDSRPPRAQLEATSREQQRELYDRYLPLVRRIAMRTVRSLPPGILLDDIVAAGWVGMTEALQRRAEDMTEEQFKAYASYRVRGAILDYLRELDPLSRKLRGATRRITDAVGVLTRTLGRMPEEHEVAGELGISLDEYQELLTSISNAGLVRLELTSAGELETGEHSPEMIVSRKEIVDAIADAFEELPERLKLILGLHYQEECSLREIGEILGVTESRVCQLHAQAVHLIRARIEMSPQHVARMRAHSSRDAGIRLAESDG